MKTITTTIAMAVCLALPGAAHAASATYTTVGGSQASTGLAAPDGRPVMGSVQDGTMAATMADGSKTNGTWKCIGTTQPQAAKIFDVHSICDAKDDKGTYSITFGCQNPGANGAQGCVGGLYGKTGAYKGRTGGTTWMGANGTGSGTIAVVRLRLS